MPEISVVILCYKAGKRIYDFIANVIEILDKKVPSWEIVLVGNYLKGSNDDTPDIVRAIASEHKNIQAVTLPKEGMMGWDARSGLDRARGKLLCLIDGDEQMPYEDIIKVYDKLKNENLDFVMTYRAERHDGFVRTANSFIYNMITKMLFPGITVRDINSKPKIFTREAYNNMRLSSNDWFLDAEMIINSRKLRLKIGQVPTVFHKCSYRKSFVKLDAVIEFIKNLIKKRLKVS